MEPPVSFNPYLPNADVMTALFNQNWEAVLNDEMSMDDLLALLEDEANLAIEEGMDRIG